MEVRFLPGAHLQFSCSAVLCTARGRLAQLVEQSVYTGKVRGSSPLSPTEEEYHPMEQIHCTISGRVQGVYLRSYIKECADARGVLGFVRNVPNGTVEIVAEGSSEVLTAFLSDVRRGSSLSQIETVDAVWGHATKSYDHFSVAYE